MNWIRRSGGLVLVTVLAIATGAACTSDDAVIEATARTNPTTAPPAVKVVVTADDYRFDVAPEVAAGFVEIEIENAGAEPHQAQVARLHDGVSFGELSRATAKNDPAALVELVDVVGGPNGVAAGESARVINALEPGPHVLICFIFSPDGREHSAQGMLAPFEVVPAGEGARAEPNADSTITMKDFSFEVPAGFTGKGTVAVVNDGEQPHELALFRLQPNRTFDDAKAFLLTAPGTPPPSPPAVVEMGGITGLEPGTTGWIELDLAPGDYVAVCFFPDPDMGNLPHIVQGMVQQISVA